MKVAVVGCGYVGLTTATALAWAGHRVNVVEIDERRVASLREGHPPFFEAHLDEAMAACARRLRFSTSHAEALVGTRAVFIAVGTPASKDGSADLSQVWSAVEQIVCNLTRSNVDPVLVTKSTVPVGTGDDIADRIRHLAPHHQLPVASNPEFLRQGRSLRDSLYPDRIVIGGPERARAVLREIYRPIVERSFEPLPGTTHPYGHTTPSVIEVDRRSAELAKYAANAFLATRISFVNEVANVCDRLGADIDSVTAIMGADPRIGSHFLHAGVGYGGSCFPKDTRALHQLARMHGYEFALVSAAIRVNESQRFRVLERLAWTLGGVEGRRIALLGLAFKAGTDDVREAPSIALARALAARGANVIGHDPRAVANARQVLQKVVVLTTSIDEALRGADAAVLMTEWPDYLSLDAQYYRARMRRPIVIDGRNALPEAVRRGVEYYGFGRGALRQPTIERSRVAAD